MNYKLEIDKLITLDNTLLVPYDSFTYRANLSNKILTSYFVSVFGAEDETNNIKIKVSSVEVDFTSYTTKTSIALCIANEESFYWDQETQYLYIHYPIEPNPFSIVTEYGKTMSFSDEGVTYDDDMQILPLLRSIPIITQSADPLQYSIMAYSDATFELINDIEDGVGEFDTDPLIVGMACRLLRDSTVQWVGRVEGYSTSLDRLRIRAVDKRKQLEVDWPTARMSVLSRYDAGWETDEQLIPDGYGSVIQVPAYPITDGSGTVTLRWATEATSITQVYTETGDTVTAVEHANFSAAGTFTLTDALCASDGADPTNGMKKVFVTGVMRSEVNPADIIADLNLEALSVPYDSDNYNTTEWEAEDDDLDNVALYMDESKKLTEWIELLQSGSNIGFRYEDITLRSIRLDNPDRALAAVIPSVAVRNVPDVDNNAELFATDALVKYAKNHRTGKYAQVTNTDYYTVVYKEHRLARTESVESLLTTSTDADDKALRIMQDISETRPVFSIVIDYSDYTAPRIYDIITVDLGFESRTFYGVQRCQVIGISPIPETDEYELTLRQRDATT